MTRAQLVALLVHSILILPACGPSEERASELRLHEEISRLRDHRGDRLLQIVVVKNMPAHTPEGHAAKDTCVRAYTELIDAEDAISKAEATMRALRSDAPPSALADVAAAQALLAKARADMPACDAAAAKLALVAR